MINKKKGRISHSSGQVALIILTVMAAALTWGLSMSERVLTDLSISEQSQESIRAFTAAEAGIEEALRTINENTEGVGSSAIDLSGLALDVDQVIVETEVIGGENEFSYPQLVQPGELVIIWLRDHDADGNMDLASGYEEVAVDVCWDSAAIEVAYFYDSTGLGDYQVRRFAFDPVADRRNNTGGDDGAGNHFSAAAPGCVGRSSGGTINFPVGGIPLFLTIRPFYQATQIGIAGLAPLPIQGYEIISTGEVVQNNQEKISRKVRVFRGWETPPLFFFDAIFSGTGLSGS